MSSPHASRIQRLENFGQWFRIRDLFGFQFRDAPRLVELRHITNSIGFANLPEGLTSLDNATNEDRVAIVRQFYALKVGEVGCRWAGDSHALIEYKYAKIKLGDVFDFYTSPDGVLHVPKWSHLKYALDEFLEEDPRHKYHPSRVQQFIDANGVGQLEAMP